jgi:RNA polymerase sigma factor (sigma-70 family)
LIQWKGEGKMSNGTEQEINNLVYIIQNSKSDEEKKDALDTIIIKLKPFRYNLAKKYFNKGIENEDIAQSIDLILIESIYGYDKSLDPSALRHITSRTRNNIWNFYRKEMNYFDDSKQSVSLDQIYHDYGSGGSYAQQSAFASNDFNEDSIIEKILLGEELAELTPHQREVLYLHFVDDKTQYDIAEELQINQSNVSRAKKRAIISLRNRIIPLDVLSGKNHLID